MFVKFPIYQHLSLSWKNIFKNVIRLLTRSMTVRAKHGKSDRITRNAFFNFLREYRQQHIGRPMSFISAEGGKLWRSMTDSDKAKFITQASLAPKTRRRHGRYRK